MNFLRISASDIAYAKAKLLYLHNGKSVGSGAFELKNSNSFRILLPRSVGVVSVCAKIYSEAFLMIKEEKMRQIGNDLYFDTYEMDINSLELPLGLYFLRFTIETVGGRVFGVKDTYDVVRLSEKDEGYSFQFSIVDFKNTEPKKRYGGIIYHVFVDRFSKGGEVKVRDDAVMMEKWEGGIPEYPEYPGAHLENNTFFGGTLYGVIDKLDYIQSLGTTLIYLSPIFEAYSNHKYDTGNYMKVDDMFGGDSALIKLIEEADKRGIGIILDGVFNHTGSDSVYFNQNGRYDSLGAYQSSESPYYKWYDFQNHPDKYTCWWGIKILPRINPDVKECGDFIAGKNGVVEKYANLGIAGFRLDVADELSDDFIARIKDKLSASKDTVLYGEVWEDASNKISYGKRKRYYLGSELDGVMNYPLREGIIDFLKSKNKDKLEYALGEVMFNAPKRIRDLQMNLLGTHDTERIITILAGESAENKTNAQLSLTYLNETAKRKGIGLVKMAYTILATLPGLPTVFYGDEVGLEGYKDPFNRRPYPWKSGNSGLREYYKKIGEIRTSSSVYKTGDFKLIHLDNELLIYSRIKSGKAYVTAVNNSDKDKTVEFEKTVTTLIGGNRSKKIVLAPMSAEIIKTIDDNHINL